MWQMSNNKKRIKKEETENENRDENNYQHPRPNTHVPKSKVLRNFAQVLGSKTCPWARAKRPPTLVFFVPVGAVDRNSHFLA